MINDNSENTFGAMDSGENDPSKNFQLTVDKPEVANAGRSDEFLQQGLMLEDRGAAVLQAVALPDKERPYASIYWPTHLDPEEIIGLFRVHPPVDIAEPTGDRRELFQLTAPIKCFLSVNGEGKSYELEFSPEITFHQIVEELSGLARADVEMDTGMLGYPPVEVTAVMFFTKDGQFKLLFEEGEDGQPQTLINTVGVGTQQVRELLAQSSIVPLPESVEENFFQKLREAQNQLTKMAQRPKPGVLTQNPLTQFGSPPQSTGTYNSN